MNTKRNAALKKALFEASSLPEPRPAQAFWQDFRARASLTMQQAAAGAEVQGSALLSLRWASAALALVLVVGAAALYLHPWVTPVTVARAPATHPVALSKVVEVEALSEYNSVMIVEDPENGGTVIWVASTDSATVP